MDGVWDAINYISFVYFRGVMTTVLKAYLLIIGLFSMVMGLWAMTAPDFVSWYPAFEDVERKTPLANFIRTMSGVFVASGYILIRFIFSSSKVQLGTVLIYLCAFMLIGKICGLIIDGKYQEVYTDSHRCATQARYHEEKETNILTSNRR